MFAEVSSANRTVIFTFKHTAGKKLRSETLQAFLKANLVDITANSM
jgi:divalent metal cation (Fe/Co/Zn/Cd) transporter